MTKPEELPITPGEAIATGHDAYVNGVPCTSVDCVNRENGFDTEAPIALCYVVGDHFDEQGRANATLYADAHNTYRRTKVLPSDLAERLEEARRLLLAIATHSEQAGNDNVRGADLRLSTPSINAFLTRTKQPEE